MSFSDVWRDRRGSIAVEAALVLSVTTIAVVGAFDAARFLQQTARAERVAANIANMTSRSEVLRDRTVIGPGVGQDDLAMFFMLARRMAEPADLAEGGIVISSVSGVGTGVVANWTRGSGTAAAGRTANLARIAPVQDRADFILAEVYMPFEPMMLASDRLGFGFSRMIEARALFRARQSDLTVLAP